MAVDVDQLYRRYGPMVLRRCRRLLADEEAAVDAMHDVFVEMLKRRDRIEDRGLCSLLYVTATRVCLNRLRTRARRPEHGDDLLHRIADVDDAASASFARLLLGAVFKGVPASSRVVAVLHHVDGLTHEQTARAVGLSVSGVRKTLRDVAEIVGEAAR